jgi:hypothetical protein
VKIFFVVALTLVTVSGAGAVDIPFRDGSVIQAESYRLTGSYILVTRADGRQVAYNAADVDLEALKAAEAEAASVQAIPEDGAESKDGLGRRGKFAGAVAAEDRERAEVSITDADVEHVGQTAAAIEERAAEPDTMPNDFTPGGTMIVVQNFKIEPLDAELGRYRLSGEVVHRGDNRALNVGALFESNSGVKRWAKRLKIADYVDAGETVAFTHDFEMELREGEEIPRVKAQTYFQVRVPEEAGTTAPARRRTPRPL